MSAPLTIKVVHGQEIRRLSFPKPPTFSALCQMVGNLYNIQLERVKPLIYRDDENDVVTIGSDLELLEAIRVAESNQQSLRLYVNKIEAGAEQVEEKEKEAAPAAPAAPQLAAASPAEAPLAAVRDAAILQQLSAQAQEAIAKLKDAYERAEVAQRFESIKASAQEHMQHASDSIRPYLVALQAYVASYQDAAAVENLQKLLQTMQAQAQKLVITTQDKLARLPAVHPSFHNIDKVPAQLYAMPGQVLAVPGQVLAALPQTVQQLPGQIASLPAQIRQAAAAYYPAAQPAAQPAQPAPLLAADMPAKAASPLPANAAEQDVLELEAMGFTDRERNIRLLAKHKGNLQMVVSELLCDSA